jgi:hypothetical protein
MRYLFALLLASSLSAQYAVPAKFGTGTWNSGWPLPPNAGVDVHIARGSDGNFVTKLVPALRVSTYASGDMGGNRAEVEIYTSRRDGNAHSIIAVSSPETSGFNGVGIQSHVLMEHGTQYKFGSGFPLWLSCQQWSKWDSCSNEINIINESKSDPVQKGEYIVPGLTNGLSLITAGQYDVSSALYIGTQSPITARWKRGIDFQQNGIRDYAIVLPNNIPIVARSADNSAKIEVVRLNASNTVSLQNVGEVNFATVPYTSLGYAPIGKQVFCRDCDEGNGGVCTSYGNRGGALAIRLYSKWKCY